ncbi:MAG: hypothetical protein FWE50_03765 [Alphaproteobacteria bacterium]|nr:hypothetical protein [Alphaproteobacteria bacterium]
MRIINIGGVINSGKSTVSKLLVERLSNSVFIEVDELLSDEEWVNFPDFMSRINERLNRLYKLLIKHVDSKQFDNIIFAYPMYDDTYSRVTEIAKDKAEFIIITLAPEIGIAQANRGTRELSEREKERILEMRDEGAYKYHKSDKIIDNTQQSPTQTVNEILEFLSHK